MGYMRYVEQQGVQDQLQDDVLGEPMQHAYAWSSASTPRHQLHVAPCMLNRRVSHTYIFMLGTFYPKFVPVLEHAPV